MTLDELNAGPIRPRESRVRWRGRRGVVWAVHNGGGDGVPVPALLDVVLLDTGRHVQVYVTHPELERELPA